MTCIDATGLSFRQVNEAIAAAKDADVLLEHALGQRYIGAGSAGRRIRIEGVPGNALGAYLDGTRIEVAGNAQDATGDTMNDGEIVIHGSCGDAAGYAMRGGRIFVARQRGLPRGHPHEGLPGKDPRADRRRGGGQLPGRIPGRRLHRGAGVGDARPRSPWATSAPPACTAACCTCGPTPCREDLPAQVMAVQAEEADLAFLRPHVADFFRAFSLDMAQIMDPPVLRPAPEHAQPLPPPLHAELGIV